MWEGIVTMQNPVSDERYSVADEAILGAFCDMLPPLKSLILKWGLLAQWLYRAKYLQAILACPAIFISPVTDFLLCCHAHSAKILFPSFMILTAAFTSRSILLPHSQ